MGRTFLTLKPFIDEHILKGYVNFKRSKKGFFELYTPRKKKGFDPANEEIFKAYETYHGRKYRGYKYRDNFKAAVRNSKIYEVKSHEESTFIFRERTPKEIVDLKKIKKRKFEKMVVTSPASSGYETGENSSTGNPDASEFIDNTALGTPQPNYESINFEDIDMEEMTGENGINDPLQELYNEAFRKFFSPNPGFSQDEYVMNDLSQYLGDEDDGTFQFIDVSSGLQHGVSVEPQANTTVVYQIFLVPLEGYTVM